MLYHSILNLPCYLVLQIILEVDHEFVFSIKLVYVLAYYKVIAEIAHCFLPW